MKKISLDLGPRSYNIIISAEGFGGLAKSLKALNAGKNAVIITNRKVEFLYGNALADFLRKNGFSVKIFTAPDLEQSKSQKVAFNLLEKIAAYDRGRTIFLAALGGGVIGDLTGFMASVYRRGIPYVQLPTTLLAQADSAIGGKTALNLPCGKNLVGTFYQPRVVFSNLKTLLTLSERDFRSGMAEVIKYGIIMDKDLFAFLEKNTDRILKRDLNALEKIIYSSSYIKARIVSRDERETKMERTLLNFGHTVGHAIEAAGGYGRAYSHGEAVAIGMVCASQIARDIGILDKNQFDRIESLLNKMDLPARINSKKTTLNSILKAQEQDKKITHKTNRFVLPIEIGHVAVFEGLPKSIITSALNRRYGLSNPCEEKRIA